MELIHLIHHLKYLSIKYIRKEIIMKFNKKWLESHVEIISISENGKTKKRSNTRAKFNLIFPFTN